MARQKKKRHSTGNEADPVHVGITLPGSPCQRLMESMKVMQQAQIIVDYHLPEHLKGHCRIGSIKYGTLTLVTDNAAWALHIKGICADLRYALQTHDAYAHIKNVIVKVKPPRNRKHQPRTLKPAQLPSEQTADMIASVAQDIQHPTLKRALQRLARHRRS